MKHHKHGRRRLASYYQMGLCQSIGSILTLHQRAVEREEAARRRYMRDRHPITEEKLDAE